MDKRPAPLIIIGAGGHGHVVADSLDPARFRLIGFVDDLAEELQDTAHPLIEHDDPQIQDARFIVAIGDNLTRKRLFEKWLERGHEPASIVHLRAIVSRSAALGRGVFVGPAAVINARTTIGDNIILNTATVIEHDVRIASHTHIAPNATLGGNVHVGEQSLVGLGASVLPQIHIGSRCTVASGAVVTRDVPDDTTVKGVPAKPTP